MWLFRWGAATASAGAGFALSPSTNKLLLLCAAESGSNMTQTKSKHSMLADVKCIKCLLLTEKKNRRSLSLIQSSFENSHCCLHPHCILSVISSLCLGRSCHPQLGSHLGGSGRWWVSSFVHPVRSRLTHLLPRCPLRHQTTVVLASASAPSLSSVGVPWNVGRKGFVSNI